MDYYGTGMSDDICRVEVKPAFCGGYYANFGHFSTPIYKTPYEAAVEGNKLATSMYGSTVRLVDLRQFRN
jgi:hypothetical protein